MLFWLQIQKLQKENSQQQEKFTTKLQDFLEAILRLTAEIKAISEEMRDVKIQVDQLTTYTIEAEKRNTGKFKILPDELSCFIDPASR